MMSTTGNPLNTPRDEGETLPSRGSRKLRWTGLLLCGIALLTAGHVVISMVKAFQGHPVFTPEFVLHIEAGIAGAAGVAGMCMLVAGAEPFDESEEPPLLKYDKQANDRFDS